MPHCHDVVSLPQIFVTAEVKAAAELARRPGETLAACLARLLSVAVVSDKQQPNTDQDTPLAGTIPSRVAGR